MEKTMNKWTMPDNYREILYEGLEIKNYTELCNYCKWKPTSSNSKNSQLQTFKSHIAYKPMGQKFIITEVRETPLEIEDGRESNGSEGIYAEPIETILYTILANVDAKELTLTKVGWLRIIGAVNQKFEQHKIMKSKNIDLATTLNVNKLEIDDLMTKVENNLWDSFDKVAKKLEYESLISQEDVLIYYTEFDTKGTMAERFTTDSDEYEEFREIRKDVLNEFGVKSEAMLFRKKSESDRDDYWKILKERTNAHFGWAGHYRAKTIRYNMEQVQRTMDIFNIQEAKITLNESVIAQAIKSATRRHNKSKKEVFVNNLDELAMELALIIELPELDEKESYKIYKMRHYYAKDEHVPNTIRILDELVALN